MADHGPSELGKILGSILNALGKKIQESVEQARLDAASSGSGTSADGKFGPLNYHIEFKVDGKKEKKAKVSRAITDAERGDVLPADTEEREDNAVDEAALKALDAFFGEEGTSLGAELVDPDFDCLGTLLMRYGGKKQVVEVPEGIETIGPGAFENVDSLRKVILPESVKAIEVRAFSACISLKEIVFSKNLELIAEDAFAGCISLETVHLPESVKHLENGVFKKCRSLREVTLPDNLRHIPSRLFQGCVALQTVHYHGTPETAGAQFFDEAASKPSEKFCYFEKNEAGDIVRVESDSNPFIDGEAFDFGNSSYLNGVSRMLQNFILSNAPWNLQEAVSHAEMCAFALRFSSAISDSPTYSAFHVARLCIDIMRGVSDGSIVTEDLKTYVAARILEVIGGNGTDLEARDRHLIMASGDISALNDGHAELTPAVMQDVMRHLGVEISPYRYHPAVYHCCARVLKDSSYWDFLICLEGLMRGRHLPIGEVAYRPEPAETMDGWCVAWSLVLQKNDLSILRIQVPAVFGGNDDVIALLSASDAREVQKIFETYGVTLPVKIYSAGSTQCDLRLV